MSEREIIKKYKNGNLNVVWKPKRCIHAAICVKTLPEVYNPDEKPWIKAENASIEALKAQIAQCPSGALSYEMEGEEDATPPETGTKVQVMPKGPLLVHGHLEVEGTSGTVETKTRTTAFCRCGASQNKPYCDGAHHTIDFTG